MSVWDEVVGQEKVVSVLQSAALAARHLLNPLATDAAVPAATSGSMSHAWLITGPPGSGRSVAAKAFAAALECEGETPGCGQCQACTLVMGGNHSDVSLIATEQVMLKVDQIRSLVSLAQQSPAQGKWRVIMLEDADRMTDRTANILLKAVEEPPEHTVWLLCAPSPDDVIITIRSRCRKLGLRIPPVQAVADLVVRRDAVDPGVALEAARAAQSHIGMARHLARNPQARERRRAIIVAPARVRSVSDAVWAAEKLVSIAKEEATASNQEREATEKADLLRALGSPEGGRLPPQVRAQIKQLEAEQKRRATRAQRDVLDRAMIDLLSLYRDVYMRQSGAEIDAINGDLLELIAEIANESSAKQTVERMQAIEIARTRLQSNVAPVLAVEAMTIALRPQA